MLFLNRVVRKGLSEKTSFESRFEGKGVRHEDIRGKYNIQTED